MKIRNITLLNPNTIISKGSIRRLPTPLGLMYIAAVLEQNHYNISILDSSCEGYNNIVESEDSISFGLSEDDLKKRITEEEPNLVGVTCNFSNQESEVMRICSLIKEVNKDIIVCVGGLHPTYRYEYMMKTCKNIDFIIKNEGEYRLLELIECINNNIPYINNDGLVYRVDNKIKSNPSINHIKDLDSLPLPARHLVDMEKYIEIGLFSNPFPKGDRPEQILTSRGCPFHCHFCATKPYWGEFRPRSAESVLEEMKELKEKYKINEIQFRDDNMLVNRKRAYAILDGMKEFGFHWSVGIMVSHLDDEMLRKMKESGCYQLTISIESGSERVLKDIIKKPFSLSIIKGIVDTAHKYGIRIHADNIIGMPGETYEEMMQTFAFNEYVNVDSVAYFLAAAYLGSPLYDQCIERGWINEKSIKSDFKNPNIYIKEYDEEYVMDRQSLSELVDTKTREFNERAKSRNPEMWKEKYKVFLKKHPEEIYKIMGRVV